MPSAARNKAQKANTTTKESWKRRPATDAETTSPMVWMRGIAAAGCTLHTALRTRGASADSGTVVRIHRNAARHVVGVGQIDGQPRRLLQPLRPHVGHHPHHGEQL